MFLQHNFSIATNALLISSEPANVQMWEAGAFLSDIDGPTRLIDLNNIVCHAVRTEVVVKGVKMWATVLRKRVRLAWSLPLMSSITSNTNYFSELKEPAPAGQHLLHPPQHRQIHHLPYTGRTLHPNLRRESPAERWYAQQDPDARKQRVSSALYATSPTFY